MDPRSALTACVDAGLTSLCAVELATGLPAGALEAYVEGEDNLTEREEIAVMRVLLAYRNAVRLVNANLFADHLIDQLGGPADGTR